MTEILDPVTQRHVDQAADALAHEFEGIFSQETISRYIAESVDLLGGAKINVFVPVLAHRFARERLRALAQVEGLIVKEQPEVLFVCVHNAGRSQMAAALVTLRSNGRVHVRSAGSDPGDEINPAVVEAMSELGVDMARAFPKPLTDEVVRAADVVITMGCGDACPIYPGKRYEDWAVDDPAGQDLETVRRIRDELDARVAAPARRARGGCVSPDALREEVRAKYAEAALAVDDGRDCGCATGCCTDGVRADCCDESCCAGETSFGSALYTGEEQSDAPEAAALASLGCGNPTAVAELRPGEVVLDLGSGGGIDVILSAKRVGPEGIAYGLDMTDEMLALAQRNAAAAGARNAIFLKGEIEQVPLPAGSVDVVISNCVVNLSTDKRRCSRRWRASSGRAGGSASPTSSPKIG